MVFFVYVNKVLWFMLEKCNIDRCKYSITSYPNLTSSHHFTNATESIVSWQIIKIENSIINALLATLFVLVLILIYSRRQIKTVHNVYTAI